LNLEADVVVVGAGIAGLAAAIEAADNGASVIVLEKSPRVGGELWYSISGGCIAASRSSAGLGDSNDSPDVHFNDLMKSTNNRANPVLLRTLVEGAPSVFDWMVSLGWETKPELLGVTDIIDTYPRSYWCADRGISPVLVEAARKKGIETKTGVSATRIIREPNSGRRVTGIETMDNRQVSYINADRGVILATGGFTNNPEMISKYDATISKLPMSHGGRINSTGEGIAFAETIGARLRDMDAIEVWAIAKGTETRPALAHDPSALMIDDQGKRFVDEGALLRKPGKGTIVVGETMHRLKVWSGFFVLNSDQVFDPYQGKLQQPKIASAGYIRAQNLSELSRLLEEKYGVPSANSENTIKQYNDFVDAGIDREFGKSPQYLRRINKAPFFAHRFYAAVGRTYGGVAIDSGSRVLDAQGKTIPGFYAAGNCVGGLMAPEQGNNATACILFGRKAGSNAAKGL
jgi:flavocytochrome c